MSKNLWKSERFLPLWITQFLGAFNDNLFKNALLVFVAYNLIADEKTVGLYSNLAAGIFILPYFLFSAIAGQFADKYDRAKIARILKITELLLMVGAMFLFMIKSPQLLILFLFFMGMQSTFFGPVKYSLLPQHLHENELIEGNAYVEASTYISIILGAILGTVLPVYFSVALLLICSVIGIFSAYKIPSAPGAQPMANINYNIWKGIKDNISLISSHIIVFRAIIGATWFWILGAFFMTEMFPLCSKVLNTEKEVVTMFLVLFSFGVGVGSIFCNKLLKGEVSVVYVPISAIGLSVCAFAIYLLSITFPQYENSISLVEFLLIPQGFLMSVFLFLFAFMGGMYVVPLNALIQKKAPKKYVATVIAGNNIINSLGMVGISVLAILLISIGCRITDLFLFISVISVGVAFYICKLLPDALMRSVFRSICGLFFRVDVLGMQNLIKAGSKTLIIANHVSLLDGLLIATYMPRKITFAIDVAWGEKWFVKMFDGLVDFYPLNPANPLSIRSLIDEVNKNKTVMIFPEGRISVTGALMKVYEGAGVVAMKSGAKIIPLCIDGAQNSKFSYIGNLVKTRMFPKIKMHIFPACQINVDNNLTFREKRHLISLKIHDIMADMLYDTADKNELIFNKILEAEKVYGSNHKIALDILKKTLSYKQFIMKTYVLGEAYEKVLSKHDKVGLLLPNSLANAVSFFALQYAKKIPVMLNFSLGNIQFESCLKTVGLQVVVTSKKFIEQGKLERLEMCILDKGLELIYLEDFAQNISLMNKFNGFVNFILRKKIEGSANEPASILFTSGSEGLPKAIILSHRNLLSNTLQVRLAVPFNSKDIFLNALPMFHSFGLTVGTILPLINGVKTYFYPSPLHYRIIPEIAYELQATVICGTDAFLYGYGRMANPYDFFQIKFAVAGGEKLKERTSDLWMKKFGVRILEGYGTTETSPVIAVNTPMYYKENTVGRFLPKIQYELQEVLGISNGGKLRIKSDNVMSGYILPDKPNKVIKHNSWYDTGDIVSIDSENFISILGREKRFAKIAGEMVSLTAVEQFLDKLYVGYAQGIIVVDDDKKGEKMIFVTANEDAEIKDIRRYFKDAGLSELWIPKEVVFMKKPPLLGTGKFDYLTAKKILEDKKIVSK